LVLLVVTVLVLQTMVQAAAAVRQPLAQMRRNLTAVRAVQAQPIQLQVVQLRGQVAAAVEQVHRVEQAVQAAAAAAVRAVIHLAAVRLVQQTQDQAVAVRKARVHPVVQVAQAF